MIGKYFLCGVISGTFVGICFLFECATPLISCPLIDRFNILGALLTFLVMFVLGFIPGFIYSIWTHLIIWTIKFLGLKNKLIGMIISTLSYLIAFNIYWNGFPDGLELSVGISVYTSGLLMYKYLTSEL